MIPLGILAAQAPPGFPQAVDLIASGEVATASTLFEFTGIPADYDSLMVIWARLDQTSSHQYRFNADTAAEYIINELRYNFTAATVGTLNPSAAGQFSTGPTSNTGPANHVQFNKILFSKYSNSTYFTSLLQNNSNGNAKNFSGGMWRKTGAVTSIQLLGGSSGTENWQVGTRFKLYGIRG